MRDEHKTRLNVLGARQRRREPLSPADKAEHEKLRIAAQEEANAKNDLMRVMGETQAQIDQVKDQVDDLGLARLSEARQFIGKGFALMAEAIEHTTVRD